MDLDVSIVIDDILKKTCVRAYVSVLVKAHVPAPAHLLVATAAFTRRALGGSNARERSVVAMRPTGCTTRWLRRGGKYGSVGPPGFKNPPAGGLYFRRRLLGGGSPSSTSGTYRSLLMSLPMVTVVPCNLRCLETRPRGCRSLSLDTGSLCSRALPGDRSRDGGDLSRWPSPRRGSLRSPQS